MDFNKDILINAAPADIAGIMFDPVREHEWMTAVKSSVPQTPGITIGAEVKRTSDVNGADVAWSTRVEAFHFPHVLRLDIGGGQIGFVRYDVQRSGTGSVARIRAVSEQDLFGFDVEKLKRLVEGA